MSLLTVGTEGRARDDTESNGCAPHPSLDFHLRTVLRFNALEPPTAQAVGSMRGDPVSTHGEGWVMTRRLWRLSVVALLSISAFTMPASAQPDLTIHADATQPFLTIEDFEASDCAIDEGCIALPGERTLLRFTTESRNVGEDDLVVGSPVGDPAFHFHECHGHYHFEGYAEYRLVGQNGIVGRGNKASFCLEDTYRFSSSGATTPRYTCSDQGIQAGWADVYGAYLDCQYIDVTGVPAGDYTLEIEVNPQRLIVESDYSNNIARIPVQIEELVPPANDYCADALTALDGANAFSTLLATTDGPSEPERCTFYGDPDITGDIWYRYTASCNGTVTMSLCGSSFDTELALYPDGCPGVSGSVDVCNDDSCGRQSELTTTVVEGESFIVRVGGYKGAQGDGTLYVSCDPGGAGNPPSNDACGDAIAVSDGVTAFSNVAATTDGPAEPELCTFFGEPDIASDIWYRYTASCTGTVSVSLCGSSYDTEVALYSDCPTQEGALACNDDSCGRQSEVTAQAVAGDALLVRVGGYSGAQGEGTMSVSCSPDGGGGGCSDASDCDDGDLCTTDQCDAGTGICGFVPITCDDGDDCTIDTCDSGSGACVSDPDPVCLCTPTEDPETSCADGEDNDCDDLVDDSDPDCDQPTGPVCGNGVCEGDGEDGVSCRADCRCAGRNCRNGNCGDGVCRGENRNNCPVDCR